MPPINQPRRSLPRPDRYAGPASLRCRRLIATGAGDSPVTPVRGRHFRLLRSYDCGIRFRPAGLEAIQTARSVRGGDTAMNSARLSGLHDPDPMLD